MSECDYVWLHRQEARDAAAKAKKEVKKGDPQASHYICLHALSGPARNRELKLQGDYITIGSRSDNAVSIKDRLLSAHHACPSVPK